MTTIQIILIMIVWGLACYFVPIWIGKLYDNYCKTKIKVGSKFENSNCRKDGIYTVEVVEVNFDEDYVKYLYEGEVKQLSVKYFIKNYVY